MAHGGPPARLRALGRLLGWPTRRLLDPRVRWTANLVDERLVEETRLLHRHLDSLESRLDDHHRGIHEKLAALRVEEMLGREAATPTELTDELGRFLNWAEGHQGYAAQAELWFNPPVALDHRAGGVRPRHVTERIVEPAFVFSALAELPPPARILDVGGSESTVALSLAALGHDLTVVDPRGFPLEHPRLRAVASRLDQLDPALTGFDAAVALSAVEHFGLGHYQDRPPRPGAPDPGAGQPPTDRRLDLAATAELRRRLRPDGILALTVPFGAPSVDDFQRVYDAGGLAELLDGWRIERSTAAWQVDPLTWVAGELDRPQGDRGVALVLARNVAD
ncbi:MAG: hypothetical protein QOE27_2641 [Solirubrobacteraceae bacterium]|nr:hypothetical protein [Solirubrobacteraceae bacterium]